MKSLFLRLFKSYLKKNRSRALRRNPQVRGIVKQVRIITPKKPNSARRSVAKVFLVNKVHTSAYIPGIGHNLRRHSHVLIRGGGARDLPGVSYTTIRGVYDLYGVSKKRRRRSIYGASKHLDMIKKIRRRYRIT